MAISTAKGLGQNISVNGKHTAIAVSIDGQERIFVAYEETNNRLQELSDKLGTLQAESNELLLRIENFTTLRLQAFGIFHCQQMARYKALMQCFYLTFNRS